MKFEMLSVDLYDKSRMNLKVIESDNVVDCVVKYFDDEGIRKDVEKDLKECLVGWVLDFEESLVIIKEIK